ncbi:hypothetical protein QBC39DRAFT_354492 [Podospora conica]|nr:hypothetical protein QBC39DRAFT_354492 [Schizothecium conicum]
MPTMNGFSIFQPTIGAPLQWLPAVGTPELDDMIHALIPGPASIQDKRAHVSMDFFEYANQTGETFKFYSVPTSIAATSPASSASFFDSGYASFNASPVVPEMVSWAPSPTALTPTVSADEIRSVSRKPTASSSRQPAADFSSHPGMRIMTRDGRDVTNSASRGCKTKEQRDHAHLMRIIKACDACKRKKIRCDPSHKKRTASQASASSSQSEGKTAKKVKKAAASPAAVKSNAADFAFPAFFGTPETPSSSFQSSPETTDDMFDQFVQFEQAPATLSADFFDFDSFINTYDHFNPSQYTPSSSASPASQEQWVAPATPVPPMPSPPVALSDLNAPQGFVFPYMNPDFAHGTSYVDFNLYSPAPDFLDEEPQSPRKTAASGRSRQQSSQSDGLQAARETFSLSASIEGVGLTHSDGYYSSPTSPNHNGSPGIEHGQRSPTSQALSSAVISTTADAGVGDHPEPGRGSGGDPGSQQQRQTTRQPEALSRSTPTPPTLPSRSSSTADAPARHKTSVVTMATQPLSTRASELSPTLGESAVPGPRATSGADRQSATGAWASSLVPSTVSAVPRHSRLATMDECCEKSLATGSRGVETQVSHPTTALLSTLPMWRDSVGGSSLLATVGLVSSLLVFALQSQFMGTEVDHQLVGPEVLILSCLYLASLLHVSPGVQGETCTKPTRPPSGGIIDNVKTKIQPFGQILGSFRCVFSRHLRTLVPRLPSLTSVRV